MKHYQTCKFWNVKKRNCKIFGWCNDDLMFPCEDYKKKNIFDKLFAIISNLKCKMMEVNKKRFDDFIKCQKSLTMEQLKRM